MMSWNDGWNNNDLQAKECAPVESVTVFGAVVKAGDRVRLWPRQNADIIDMALKGKLAIIEAIESDFDDRLHVAVVLEDDPGRDLGMLRQPGHRFFFSPEEIEPVPLDLTPLKGEVTDDR